MVTIVAVFGATISPYLFFWQSAQEMEAVGFYAVIALATLLGITIDWPPLDPIKALFWSAVVDGVIAVPIMSVNAGGLAPRHGGRFTASPRLLFFGWIAMR